MKGLILRIVAALGLLLWAIDMVFPWQQIMQSEENRYTAIQTRGKLVVGTINNSISYFIGTEGPTGLEYELSDAFAKYLGVELEIVPMNTSEELFNALSKNQIDIAAANLFYQPKRAEQFQIGPAYSLASWQVVYRKGENRPRTLQEIDGKLTITTGTEVADLLVSQKEKAPNLKWQVEDRANQEELLLQVADGTIDYTIANSIDVSAAQQIKPNIAVAFDVTDESSIHWYLSSNTYSELQAALLDFMNESINNGLIAKVEEKYFNHFANFDYVDMRAYLKAVDSVLPKYQKLFEKYKGDLDWRMLAAVAYQESHWDENATSPTGVRGMMMLTKDTADRMNISDRTNAAQSIKAGSEYLHLLISQMPETIPQEDRIWFALAAYNMGLGHVLDVRRLTKSLGGDPDNWLDVKKNLPLLAEKRYHSRLKYGYARGYEAFQYVENIRRYLNSILNYHRVQESQVAKEQEIKEQKLAQQAEVNVEVKRDTANQSPEVLQPVVPVTENKTTEIKVVEAKAAETVVEVKKALDTQPNGVAQISETKAGNLENAKKDENKSVEKQLGEAAKTIEPQAAEASKMIKVMPSEQNNLKTSDGVDAQLEETLKAVENKTQANRVDNPKAVISDKPTESKKTAAEQIKDEKDTVN